MSHGYGPWVKIRSIEEIEREEADNLLTSIKKNDLAIRVVDLIQFKKFKPSVKIFLNALAGNTYVNELRLSLEDENTIELLAVLFEKNKVIKNLTLKGILRMKSAEKIALILKDNSFLEKLDLSALEIGEKTASIIIQSFYKNESIFYLNLNSSFCTAKNLKTFEKILENKNIVLRKFLNGGKKVRYLDFYIRRNEKIRDENLLALFKKEPLKFDEIRQKIAIFREEGYLNILYLLYPCFPSLAYMFVERNYLAEAWLV